MSLTADGSDKASLRFSHKRRTVVHYSRGARNVMFVVHSKQARKKLKPLRPVLLFMRHLLSSIYHSIGLSLQT